MHTPTGRPSPGLPWLWWLFALLALAVGSLEAVARLLSAPQGPGGVPHYRRVRAVVDPVLGPFLQFRAWIVAHPALATAAGLVVVTLFLLVVRQALIVWYNHVVARFSGTRFAAETPGFPLKAFDLLAEIAKRPKGFTFVGLSPERWLLFFRRWIPVYLSPAQRSMHRHVMGKTGSGKTLSVLWPEVLQDALDGKGVLVIDAKGSDENIQAMKGIAQLARREEQLRIFALPAWNQPLFSHAYNMMYVRPRGTRGPTDPGGDPVVVAERVFSVMPLGDNEYYNTQAQVLFVNIAKLLHGMVDGAGVGLPFTFRDMAVALKGIGGAGGWEAAYKHCMRHSLAREAVHEIESQVARLGNDAQKCFSGIIGAVDKFQAPLCNAYDPDIVFEDILQTNGLVYAQLPANLFKVQAPAMGKVILMDVEQEGSLRQVFRKTRNQTPFSVVVDEFYNFADLSIVDSLNKLRDAHLEFTLAHQALADLELVSPEFASAVWDNTRTKDVLSQDNPELCERISKCIGTRQVIEKTVRQQQGALFTSLTTGDASTKLVEQYTLHPNCIKSLKRAGQGYVYNSDGLKAVSYGMFPTLKADYPLPCNNQEKALSLIHI